MSLERGREGIGSVEIRVKEKTSRDGSLDEAASHRGKVGGGSILDQMGGEMASAGVSAEGAGRQASLHGVEVSEVSAGRLDEQMGVRLVARPPTVLRMSGAPSAQAGAGLKSANRTGDGGGVEKEEVGQGLSPGSPNTWTLLAWPQEGANGG